MTTEEKIVELETNCKAMTAEIEKLKAELAEKDKNETVWIPKSDEKYLYVYTDGGIYERWYDNTQNYDNNLISMNAVFKSTNSVGKHLEWYRDNILKVHNKLMQLHEVLCPDYFPDWGNEDRIKFYLYYNYKRNVWDYDSCWCYCDYVVYFTEEAAEKACEILNREKFMME